MAAILKDSCAKVPWLRLVDLSFMPVVYDVCLICFAH
jgi:hypothetical protein